MTVTFRSKSKKPFAAPWADVKEDWINTNLEPGRKETYSFKELAVKWGLKYKTLTRISALEKWQDQLYEAKQQLATASIARVQSIESFNESEVRLRHAVAAREALELGISKIKTLKAGDLTNREAIELMKLGLEGERKALGLPDNFSLIPGSINADGTYKPVADHIKDQVKMRMLTARLLRFAERTDESV